MSQLVRLEGKHTTQRAHCAVMTRAQKLRFLREMELEGAGGRQVLSALAEHLFFLL